jgi:hypothetical protein
MPKRGDDRATGWGRLDILIDRIGRAGVGLPLGRIAPFRTRTFLMTNTLRRITPVLIGTAFATTFVAAPVAAQDLVDTLDFGSGTAVVELAGERYEFDMSTREIGEDIFVGACRGIYGAIQARGRVTDDRAITVEMELPPVDWEAKPEYGFDPPSIALEDADSGSVWVADSTYTEFLGTEVENPSLVVLTENDGLVAMGTAVFVDGQALDRGEAVEPLEGTWELRCDEEEE